MVQVEIAPTAFALGLPAGPGVVRLNGVPDADELTAINPALIVLRIEPDPASAICAVRALSSPAAAVPILALVAGHDRAVNGADALIPSTAAPAQLRQAIALLTPAEVPNAYFRVEYALGRDQIERLAHGLRDLLVAALGSLDTDELPGMCHRIAGAAGTLGFDALGQAWHAMSAGPRQSRRPLVLQTRRTIAAINMLSRRPASDHGRKLESG